MKNPRQNTCYSLHSIINTYCTMDWGKYFPAKKKDWGKYYNHITLQNNYHNELKSRRVIWNGGSISELRCAFSRSSRVTGSHWENAVCRYMVPGNNCLKYMLRRGQEHPCLSSSNLVAPRPGENAYSFGFFGSSPVFPNLKILRIISVFRAEHNATKTNIGQHGKWL